MDEMSMVQSSQRFKRIHHQARDSLWLALSKQSEEGAGIFKMRGLKRESGKQLRFNALED
jgi:hypothetical protein